MHSLVPITPADTSPANDIAILDPPNALAFQPLRDRTRLVFAAFEDHLNVACGAPRPTAADATDVGMHVYARSDPCAVVVGQTSSARAQEVVADAHVRDGQSGQA